MRQGITTRYLGPTNSRGSRIKAVARKASSWGPEMSLTEPRAYQLNTDEDHTRVAKLLAAKLGWDGLFIAGGKPEEDGNMYVNMGVPEKVIAEMIALGDLDRMGKQDKDWFWVKEVAK